MKKRSMEKRITAGILTGILAVSLLTGCGNSTSTNGTGSSTAENQSTKTQSAETGSVAVDNADAEDDVFDLEAAFAKESAAGEPLRIINTFSGTCQVQTQMAYLLGFYEAEGLVEGVDYEFVDTNGEIGITMLATGTADVAIALISGILQPMDNGLEAKAIIGLHTGCITIVTLEGNGIDSPADLKGKTIGVTALSESQHIAALRALTYEGISPDEVEFVVYDKDSIQQALLNGAVDAIGLGDYQAAILEKEEGAKIIFDTSTDERLKDENCCVLFAGNAAIEKRPATLAKLVTAIQKASIWISNHPELAAQIQIAQGYSLGDVNVNTELLKRYKYPVSLTALEEAMSRNFDDAQTLSLLKEDTDKDALLADSYIFLPGVADGLDITEIEPPYDPEQFLTADGGETE